MRLAGRRFSSPNGLPTLVHHLLRAFGHLPIPRVQGIAWRLVEMFGQPQSAEYEVGFYGLRYRGLLDDLIDRNIFFFGSYARNELDFLATAAGVLGRLQSIVTYFDVGAHVGQHAMFMSQHVDIVFAFEPSQAARERFQANLTLNRITNVRIFPFALGDSDGEGKLGSGFKGNSGSRSLTWTHDQDAVEIVAIRHGDDFLREKNLPRMDILKLDVEGYEEAVLKGLHERLMRDRPVILMELMPLWLPPSWLAEKRGFASEAELRDSLYPEHTLFTLRGERKAKLTPFNFNSEAAVCVPREHESLFKHVIAST